MDQWEMEELVRNLNTRTKRIEQILPTLATKEDLEEVRRDLNAFATKEDLKVFATKEDLKAFATNEDLKAYPTRDEVKSMIEEEGKQTRRHFDVVAEGLKESIKVISDGHIALGDRIISLGRDIKSVLTNHERRITKLEAGASKRR